MKLREIKNCGECPLIYEWDNSGTIAEGWCILKYFKGQRDRIRQPGHRCNVRAGCNEIRQRVLDFEAQSEFGDRERASMGLF